MLSRVANNIYWLGRYIERAEDTARLIQVTAHLQLDLPKNLRGGWGSIVQILGAQPCYRELYQETDERQVLKFLIGDTRNPGSILSSLKEARENARTIRDIIPREVWEQINSNYQAAKADATKALWPKHRYEFLRQVIAGSQTITGMLAGTMLHDAGYQFLRMGRNLERADMTSRTLDVRTAGLVAATETGLTPFENIQWMSVLKSLTAYQMYRRSVQGPVRRADVLNFLLKDCDFPRAVLHCLSEVTSCTKSLKRSAAISEHLRSITAGVEASEPGSMDQEQVHKFLDGLQLSLVELDKEIRQTYFS